MKSLGENCEWSAGSPFVTSGISELSPNLVDNVTTNYDLPTEGNPTHSAKTKLEITIVAWAPNGGVEQERILMLEAMTHVWKNL